MSGLPTTYSPALLKSAELRPLAELGSSWLEGMIRPVPDPVSVEWDTTAGPDRKDWLSLRLRDFAGTSSAAFDPKEFENASRLSGRLWQAYGDLLQNRTDVFLDKWLGSSGTTGNGHAGSNQ